MFDFTNRKRKDDQKKTNNVVEILESNKLCPLCEIINDERSRKATDVAVVADDVIGVRSFEAENKENYAPPQRSYRRENKENIY